MDTPTDIERREDTGRLSWRKSWPAFAAAMRGLIGTDRPSAVAAFLGHGIRPQMVRDWRLGKAGIPSWAVETTRQQAAQWLANTIDRVTPGPGRNSDIHKRNPLGGAYSWHAHKSKAPPT